MTDPEDFIKWVCETVHPRALLICPDYGTHLLGDRIGLLHRRWKKWKEEQTEGEADVPPLPEEP